MDRVCECGCGEPIEPKPHHKYKGVPRFRPGHQARSPEMQALAAARRVYVPPPNPGGLCMCGCGALTPRATYHAPGAGVAEGEHLRFIHGHNHRGKFGPDHPRWTGGRLIRNGYALRRLPTHPAADAKGYVLEHRLVAEQTIGRPLAPGEVVHHIDRNPLNNAPDNLQVMTHSEHSSLHAVERWDAN
jgi:hypothetical protein